MLLGFVSYLSAEVESAIIAIGHAASLLTYGTNGVYTILYTVSRSYCLCFFLSILIKLDRRVCTKRK